MNLLYALLYLLKYKQCQTEWLRVVLSASLLFAFSIGDGAALYTDAGYWGQVRPHRDL